MFNLDNIKSKYFRYFRIKLNKFLKPKYNIVSLGPNCYPKTIFTRWKLKRTKECGELTLPFDLVWFHQASFVTDFISNDFKDFFKDLRYMDHVSSWDNYEMVNFSHEKNFGPDDKDKLVNMYKKRIENFKIIIDSEQPILFVQILKNKKTGQDITNLYSALKTHRKNKPFALVIVDTINIIESEMPDINILKTKELSEDIDVFNESFYKSKSGIEFEKQIIDYCKKIIKEKLKCKVIKFI